MKLWLRAGLCTAVVAAGLLTGAGSVSAACERIEVEAYDVYVEVERRVYHPGETAVVEAMVLRKDTGAPVAGAKFAAIVPFRKAILYGVDTTDARGHAVARLRLSKRYVQTGPARLWAYAYEELADTYCATVVEKGEKRIRNAFTIKPRS